MNCFSFECKLVKFCWSNSLKWKIFAMVEHIPPLLLAEHVPLMLLTSKKQSGTCSTITTFSNAKNYHFLIQNRIFSLVLVDLDMKFTSIEG